MILWLSSGDTRGSESKLEIVSGYSNFDFETRKEIYAAPNIYQVISNSNIILILLEDGQMDCLQINEIFGLSVRRYRLTETLNIHHIYLGHDWLLFGRETVIENEFMQIVEFYTATTLLSDQVVPVAKSLLNSIIEVASAMAQE